MNGHSFEIIQNLLKVRTSKLKNSIRIFLTDMKNIGINWVAAVLIGGLVLLPSLYAWFNIAASWDPYGQTEQIPVGVVNEDTGAKVRGEEIDVGQDLVDTLKDSDAMGWQFVDKKTAMDKLEYGDYFAVIVIPENFSENLGTVIKDNPQKATIEYYVNEKINAIAPKITEKGASVIVEQISSNFISTVNGVIFDMFNEVGLEIEKDLPDIEQFEEYVFTLEENLPDIHKTLNESLTDANNAQDIIAKAQKMMPDVKSTTNAGLETIDETTAFLNEAEDRLNEMAPKIEEDLEKVQTVAHDINSFMEDIQNSDIDFSTGKEITDKLNERIDNTIQRIETIENLLREIKEQNKKDAEDNPDDEEGNRGDEDNPDDEEGNQGDEDAPEDGDNPDGVNPAQSEAKSSEQSDQIDEEIDRALEELAALKEELQNIQDNLYKVDDFIDEKEKEVDEVITNLQELTQNTSERIDAFVKEYKESIEPRVLGEIQKAKNTLADARGILKEIQSTIPEVEKILNRTDKNLGEGKGTLEDVLNEFPYVNTKVNELADRIRKVQSETDINEIIELLKNDPDAESSFFKEPVKLHENSLFPIENYGTGMTPFYTVLAIWVGALLLISLLSVDVHRDMELTDREIYFGRYFTFMVIGLLQTAIVTIGDMLLVGVSAASGVWFVLFGLLISIVFMLIVYSLVSVFGDVGKALAIILLVLQIAGSGGTYPTVLLPEFFQMINPLLPFTYAVDLLREAVGGIVWERALRDIGFLSMFGMIAVVFGAFLKKPINKQTHKLAKKSKESGLFH